ncbi:hypothetical protein LCGC14_2748400, partial [marine sediment metagenome]
LIYVWLIVHAGFGLWRRRHDIDWSPSRWPLIVALGVGVFWLPVAMVSPVWATVLIFVMLGGAVTAFLLAPPEDPWLGAAPLGLFAGWLTAASFVSLGLLAAGWGYAGQQDAAWIALLAALVVAAVIQSAGRSPFYGAAVAWALIAVGVQNLGGSIGLQALGFGGALVMAALAFAVGRRRV